MPVSNRAILGALAATVTFIGLMLWYAWGASPLRQDEINDYLAQIEAQTHEPGGRHDLEALRTFMEEDDGRPVYTVNLYAFHEVADYPENSEFSGSGAEAYDRFAAVMLRLMAARASHPIFGSDWADAAQSGWDRVVVVRYRSRRDLVDLFATDAFAAASLHKWASIKRHERMLVTALHIPGGTWSLGLLAVGVGLAAFGLVRQKGHA